MTDPAHDIEIRQWCVEKAVELANVNASADKVLENAQKFYGFILRNEANVYPLVTQTKKDQQ